MECGGCCLTHLRWSYSDPETSSTGSAIGYATLAVDTTSVEVLTRVDLLSYSTWHLSGMSGQTGPASVSRETTAYSSGAEALIDQQMGPDSSNLSSEPHPLHEKALPSLHPCEWKSYPIVGC